MTHLRPAGERTRLVRPGYEYFNHSTDDNAEILQDGGLYGMDARRQIVQRRWRAAILFLATMVVAGSMAVVYVNTQGEIHDTDHGQQPQLGGGKSSLEGPLKSAQGKETSKVLFIDRERIMSDDEAIDRITNEINRLMDKINDIKDREHNNSGDKKESMEMVSDQDKDQQRVPDSAEASTEDPNRAPSPPNYRPKLKASASGSDDDKDESDSDKDGKDDKKKNGMEYASIFSTSVNHWLNEVDKIMERVNEFQVKHYNESAKYAHYKKDKEDKPDKPDKEDSDGDGDGDDKPVVKKTVLRSGSGDTNQAEEELNSVVQQIAILGERASALR